VTYKIYWRLGIETLCTDRRRTALSVFGVALGVALLFSIHLATSRAGRDIEGQGGPVNRAPFEIVSYFDRPIADATYEKILKTLPDRGIHFIPVVRGEVPAEDGTVLRIYGLDMVALPFLLDGTPSGRPSGALDLLRTPTLWGSAETLTGLGLDENGGTVTLPGPRGPVTVQVFSTEEWGGSPRTAAGFLVGDIGWVRPLLGMKDVLSSILVAPPPGTGERFPDELRRILPDDLYLQTPSERILRTKEVIRAFRYNLTALSLMALMVGMFLVHNALRVSVSRRRTEIGVLRVLGMTRLQTAALFVLEGCGIGALGSLAGVAVGGVFARYAVGGVTATIRTLYGVAVGTVDHGAFGFALWPLGAGILASAAAAFFPALEAARIDPALTVRRGALDGGGGRQRAKKALLGVALIVTGISMAFFVRITTFPFAGFAGIFLMTVGLVLTAGYVLSGAVTVGRGPLRRLLGVDGILAAESLRASAGRMAMAVAAVAVSLGSAVGILILIHSFRTSVQTWIDGNLSADLYLKPAACQGRVFCDETLPEDTLRDLNDLDGIRDVYAFRGFSFRYAGRNTHIGFSDIALLRKYSRLRFVDGSAKDTVLERLLTERSVIVSEPFAYRFGLGRGDTIRVPTPRGEKEFSVAGVYYDYSTELGYVIADRRFLKEDFGLGDAHTLGVYLDGTVSIAEMRRRIDAAFPGGTFFTLESGDLRSAVLSIFDRTFAVTEGIYLIALLIALLGVAGTLYSRILDRQRDYGILRYLGMDRRGVMRVIFAETSLVSLSGTLLGCAFGVLLGAVLVFVVNKQSFGWSVSFALPPGRLVLRAVPMTVVTTVSAWGPSRTAAHLRPDQVVARE